MTARNAAPANFCIPGVRAAIAATPYGCTSSIIRRSNRFSVQKNTQKLVMTRAIRARSRL